MGAAENQHVRRRRIAYSACLCKRDGISCLLRLCLPTVKTQRASSMAVWICLGIKGFCWAALHADIAGVRLAVLGLSG